jgi:hypothetical protein
MTLGPDRPMARIANVARSSMRSLLLDMLAYEAPFTSITKRSRTPVLVVRRFIEDLMLSLPGRQTTGDAVGQRDAAPLGALRPGVKKGSASTTTPWPARAAATPLQPTISIPAKRKPISGYCRRSSAAAAASSLAGT